MRIGMITTGYPHARDAVAGAFVRAMARALVGRGHAVRVVCARRAGDEPVGDPGIDVVPVRYALRDAWATTFYGAGAPDALFAQASVAAWCGALGFATVLPRAADRALRDCDALVSHFVIPCAPAAGLARRGRPHVAIAHGSDAWLLARLPAFAQRAVLAGATHVQLTHQRAADSLCETLRSDPRVFVEPMGFEPTAPCDREGIRRGMGIAPDEIMVLAVARAVPVKGLDVLVAAAERVSARVVIAGDGPERARLEGGRARFVGRVDAATRDGLLCAADVFVAPSRPVARGRTDGAPVAVVEAMGAGLAVIASRTGGLAELVGDAGVLVAPGDVAALADAIAQLARDPEQRVSLGRRARDRALPWRWSEAAARLEARLTDARSASRAGASTGTASATARRSPAG